MSVISEAEAKVLVISRLRQAMEKMPASERNRPRYIINFKAYSVLDLINEVERWSNIGKEYVFSEVKRLGYVVS